jgi:hypothetical protein
MLRAFIRACKFAYRKRQFRAGASLSRFIAPDIRRDVEVVDASEVCQGFIIARVRTWNVLHVVKGLVPRPEFSGPRRVPLEGIWDWKGARWGGPIPDEEPEEI